MASALLVLIIKKKFHDRNYFNLTDHLSNIPFSVKRAAFCYIKLKIHI